jgi:hypothetical protein
VDQNSGVLQASNAFSELFETPVRSNLTHVASDIGTILHQQSIVTHGNINILEHWELSPKAAKKCAFGNASRTCADTVLLADNDSPSSRAFNDAE